jgi:pyruvate/2-oxoglutarate dehydrogenase complex dihydrolipoamide dehydrogenase (E3) component/uncharacterized membrane protein YdjX (TVP38/TMEM64 family)
MNYDFHTIVIGAGSGGLTSSIALSKVGKKVLLIEKGLMGGECTNTGCIPSKALIYRAHEYARAKKRAGETEELKKYRRSVLKEVRSTIKEVRDEETPEEVEKKHGVKVMMGAARFVDSHTVAIDTKEGKTIEKKAEQIVIATGSSPRTTEIPGIQKEQLLTNESLFEISEIPEKLLVLGGGAIGCEMAEAFHLLGSQVTIVTNKKFLLPQEEPAVAEALTKSFEEQGIQIIKEATIEKIEGDRAFFVALTNQELPQKSHRFDKLLMAIGREANVQGLDLEKAGIDYSSRGIVVDAQYRTSQKHISAVGDVSSRMKFTHVADDQGRHVMKRSLLKWLTPASNHKPIPRVTYLQQEVASVGMTSMDAKEQYGEESIMTVQMPYGNSDRAITDEVAQGIVVLVCKRLTGKILGVSMMGSHAGEMISFFTLAIQEKISLYRINSVIIPYPVLGRIIKKLSDQFIGQQLESLKPDLKWALKHSLPKLTAAFFWLVLILAFFWYRRSQDMSSLELLRQLLRTLSQSPLAGVGYIVLYAMRPLVFFPATLLTIGAGALFGFWSGLFWTVIAANISASVAYGVGRYFGKDLLKGEGSGLLQEWKRALQARSFLTVLIMRFIFLPFDLVNYLCGILGIRWSSYVLATFLGTIIGSATFVSLGATLENIESLEASSLGLNGTQLLLTGVLFASSLAIAKGLQSFEKKAKKGDNATT